VLMLQRAGYDVATRDGWVSAEQLDHEGHFDLVVIALGRGQLQEAAAYSDRLSRSKPTLPILLLTDVGVFAPKATLSRSMDSSDPKAFLLAVANLLAGSSHIRELDEAAG
jgi:DNA-binding NtrC family response regulator